MPVKIDYQNLKETAAALRKNYGVNVQVKDLIALAPANDPFYVGSPSQRRDAEWFAGVYEKIGAGGGIHLRRVHYRILDLPESARKLPVELSTKVDGKLSTFTHYENYERCWEWLTNAAKYARYLDLVPVTAFVDNRAKEDSFKFYAGDGYYFDDPAPGFGVSGEWETRYLPELPELDRLGWLPELPGYQARGYRGIQQRYHVEIWVEKSEGEDVILPLCQKYKVNFIPGVGDMSITTTHRFCQRVRAAGKPARLLYISDFDPSGFNMPVAVSRKLEHFVLTSGYEDLDITLEPIMLTADQVTTYNLPPAPVKDSDGRKEEWEAEYGGAVELNAMFARDDRIAAARRIIEAVILRYYDSTLAARAEEQRTALVAALSREEQAIREDYQGDIAGLSNDYEALRDEWNELRREFNTLVAPFQERLEVYRERLEEINGRGESLYGTLSSDLEATSIDPAADYPLPEPKETPVNGVLYYSRRDYWQQLVEYHAHKVGGDNAAWLPLLTGDGKDFTIG